MKRSLLPCALILALSAPPSPAAFITTGEVLPIDPAAWTSSTSGYVGKTSSGSLTVGGGSDLVSQYGYLGYANGATGDVVVEGSGSTWNNSEILLVGVYGNGTLRIANGGNVVANTTALGEYGGASGTVTVDGAASQWNPSGLGWLFVGDAGNGALNILNGGNVNVNSAYLGNAGGSTGAVTVDGAGSQWSIAGFGELCVGNVGSGTLTITRGGNVNSGTAYLALTESSTGTATVDGPGSTWTNDSTLYVGMDGLGTLNITNGGSVHSAGGYIACYSSGLTSSATIDGAGSEWLNSAQLNIGHNTSAGRGMLSIKNGGRVSNAVAYIGDTPDSTGIVTLQDAGSQWINTSDLHIGYDGDGYVTQTGGTNSVAGTLSFGTNNLSKGVYNLNGGTLILKSLVKGSGTATFNFGGGTLQVGNALTISIPLTLTGIGGLANIDTNGYAVTLSGAISGLGGLNKLGSGTLSLTKNTLYYGDTKISGGDLVATYSLSNSTLDYDNYGGTLNFGSSTGFSLGGLKGSQSLSLTNASSAAVALTVGNNGQSTEYGGSLTGIGSLTKTGSGTLTLSGANSFSGSTTLKAGTLLLDYSAGGANKLSDTNDLQIQGTSTLQLKGGAYTEVVSATALTGGFFNLARVGGGTALLRMNNITSSNGACMYLTVADIADTDTINTNNILAPSGRACITMGGQDWAANSTNADDGPITAYTAYQTGAENSWAATDNVSIAGSMALSANRSVNTIKINPSNPGQSLNIGSNQTLLIDAGGLLFVGDHDYSITAGTIRSMTPANSDLIINTYGTGVLSIGSVIADGNGKSTLTKTGNGILNLTGSNTFTGEVYIYDGFIRASSSSCLGKGSSLVINGGGLQFGGASASYLDQSMTFQSEGAILDTQSYNISWYNSIGGDGGLTKLGSGTLTLNRAETYGNNFSGALNINGGLINVSRLNLLGTGNILNFDGGGLKFGGIFDPSVRTMTFLPGGATLDTQSNDVILNNPVGNGGAGGLTKMGSGKLTLKILNSYRGDTTVLNGILDIQGGIDAGGTSLIDVQTGMAILETTNVNKPNLNVRTVNSVFKVANGSHTIGAITGEGFTQIENEANLTAASISQRSLIIGSMPTVNQDWIVPTGNWSTSANWKGGEPTYGNNAYINNGGTATITSSYEVCKDLYLGKTIAGTIEMSNGWLNTQREYVGYSGIGTFNQSGGSNYISSGLILGSNSESRGFYNLNGGTLTLNSLVKGDGTAVFNIGGGTLKASGNFSTSLPMTLTGNGGDAQVHTDTYSVTLSGVLSGSGGLRKGGKGTLTLDALETYRGNTVVGDGGTLLFTGGIDTDGTKLIYVDWGTAALSTTNVNKSDLNIVTATSRKFEIIDGTHAVGIISGKGITLVDDGAVLTAASITQKTLIIGGTKLDGETNPVPEPATWLLLFISLLALSVRKLLERRRA